jgi:hypothetical protein
VQGHLVGEKLSVLVETSCAQTQRPLKLEINSDLDIDLHSETVEPLIFSPTVHWAEFKEPNIIHAF